MKKFVLPVVLVYIFTTIAWVLLSGSVHIRTVEKSNELHKVVGELWGANIIQRAPVINYKVTRERLETDNFGNQKKVQYTEYVPVNLNGSDIKVKFDFQPRLKGLLWYSTYAVQFDGTYSVVNTSKEKRKLIFNYYFPDASGVFDDFKFVIDGKAQEEIQPDNGVLAQELDYAPGQERIIRICYKTNGMDTWHYSNGEFVNQVKNFKLLMNTNFDAIDFADNTISPTVKKKVKNGWDLTWQYNNLISSINIGLVMPQNLNPGPLIARITLFAPVSLLMFTFVVFVISAIKRVRIHPMHYFFISCAFFSFHLLMAYLAVYVEMNTTFLIASAVSIFLVISYMRGIVGIKYATLQIGLAQFVYLVLFSYTFFFEGYTGLSITIMSILTLFVIMQVTMKVNWDEVFAEAGKPVANK